MKVIDLLNKIANGEEVPKKIKVGYYYYEYEENGEYVNTENIEDLLFDFDSYYLLEQCLNDEVEIIEEDKKIEKLETYKEIDDVEHYANILKVSKNGEYEIDEALSVVVDKINEIIDKLN